MDRDDAVIGHYKSRCHQPKVLSEAPRCVGYTKIAKLTAHDIAFGGLSNQIDDNRFNYMGVSTCQSPSYTKKTLFGCVGSSAK